MKKSRLFKIIFQILISGALTALIVYLVLPDFNNKYKADLKDAYSESNTTSIHLDMNGDGISESISLSTIFNSPSIIIREGVRSTIIDQWNFPAGYFGDYGFANFNNDNLQEFYILFFSGDSINLYQITPISKSKKISIFICMSSKLHNEIEHPGTFSGSVDLNHDGFNEIIYSLEAGFTKMPRKIIAWDVRKDTLYSSPYSGTAIYYPEFSDINDDGNVEFYGQTRSFENCIDFPYPDTTAWLMLLDHNLNFLFEPKRIGIKYSVFNYRPIKMGMSKIIIGLHISNSDSTHSDLLMYSQKGEFINRKSLLDDNIYENAWLQVNNDKNLAYLIRTDKRIDVYDTSLNLVNSFKVKKLFDGRPIMLDIDGDGTNELIFKSALLGEVIIYRDDFSDPVTIHFDNPGQTQSFSVKINKGEHPLLSIHSNNQQSFYYYGVNKMYYLRFLIYLVIFAFIFYLLWLGYYMKKVKLVSSSKIMELEVKSVSNQMESHFTLNTLNAIGSLYAQDDKEKADYYFGKYARLVRNTLIQSDKIAQTLEQELDYVRNYLDIQKFRLNERFDFAISIKEHIDLAIMVPKMILFTFVENAVKHGIRNKDGKGKLTVDIYGDPGEIKIEIIDDGIGRDKAREYSKTSTGKGMQILDEILDLYQQQYHRQVKYEIKDLFDSAGLPAGTLVSIML